MARRIRLPGRSLPPLDPVKGAPPPLFSGRTAAASPPRRLGTVVAGHLIYVGTLLVLGADQVAYAADRAPHSDAPQIGVALSNAGPGQSVTVAISQT